MIGLKHVMMKNKILELCSIVGNNIKLILKS